MKFLPVIFLLFFSFLSVKAVDIEEEIKKIIDRAVKTCEVKEHVTDEDIADAKTYSIEKWTEAFEVKCFSDCFFEEIGLVRKGNNFYIFKKVLILYPTVQKSQVQRTWNNDDGSNASDQFSASTL